MKVGVVGFGHVGRDKALGCAVCSQRGNEAVSALFPL